MKRIQSSHSSTDKSTGAEAREQIREVAVCFHTLAQQAKKAVPVAQVWLHNTQENVSQLAEELQRSGRAEGPREATNEDRRFLESIAAGAESALQDDKLMLEFADRLAQYPQELVMFVRVYATVLQRHRQLQIESEQLRAENEQLVQAVAQIQAELAELLGSSS